MRAGSILPSQWNVSELFGTNDARISIAVVSRWCRLARRIDCLLRTMLDGLCPNHSAAAARIYVAFLSLIFVRSKAEANPGFTMLVGLLRLGLLGVSNEAVSSRSSESLIVAASVSLLLLLLNCTAEDSARSRFASFNFLDSVTRARSRYLSSFLVSTMSTGPMLPRLPFSLCARRNSMSSGSFINVRASAWAISNRSFRLSTNTLFFCCCASVWRDAFFFRLTHPECRSLILVMMWQALRVGSSPVPEMTDFFHCGCRTCYDCLRFLGVHVEKTLHHLLIGF